MLDSSEGITHTIVLNILLKNDVTRITAAVALLFIDLGCSHGWLARC